MTEGIMGTVEPNLTVKKMILSTWMNDVVKEQCEISKTIDFIL